MNAQVAGTSSEVPSRREKKGLMSAQLRRLLTRLSALALGAMPLAALATYPVDPTVVPKWKDPLPFDRGAGWDFMPKVPPAARPPGLPANVDYYEMR